MIKDLQKYFRPEFLNRIDEIILFKKLSRDNISKIVLLQIQEVEKRLKEKNISLKPDQKALDYLSQKGFDTDFGARPLKRVIQRELLNPLAGKIIAGELKPGANIKISANDLNLELTY